MRRVIKSYTEPVRRAVSEFWSEERIRAVRKMAETALPHIDGTTPSVRGRVLDKLIFKDLRPSSLKEALARVDSLGVDVGVDFFGARLEVPLYVGDMSFGALSGNPNIAIAKAVTEAGAVAGIGEGGLHPEVAKYRNIVVQWASARFGMDLNLLRAGLAVNIKIGQGAKPGIGGHLPGRKVVDVIAKLRKIPVGSDALSPAPHHDIYSIEDLAQRVKALRDLSGKPVLVKVAAVNKISFVAVGVARSSASGIIIDGAGAGTGAAPVVTRDNLGIPIDYATPVVDMWLRREGLRAGFLVIAGGMLATPMDIAKIVAMGADMANVATAALVAMGCIMCHSCHTGDCPAALTNMIGGPKVLDIEWASQRLVNYLVAVKRGLKAILYALGMSKLSELVGRRDLLEAYYIDGHVAETLGVELREGGDVAWIEPVKVHVHREYYEEGRPPITGMGGVVPGYTTPARRPLDLLRIEATQVTRPPVDPYREGIDVTVRVDGEEYYTPVTVPAADDAAVLAAYALGAPVYGENSLGIKHVDEGAVVIAPGQDISVDSGIVIIDERLGGSITAEEAVSRLDIELRRRDVRDRVCIAVAGMFYTGADVYKLAALGADLVVPLGIFTYVHERVRHLDLRARMMRYENTIAALTKELKLLMGAGGVTNYYNTLVGNRDLLRSLDGKIARALGVEVAGR